MSTSRDTLLRLVRDLPDPPPPRAWRGPPRNPHFGHRLATDLRELGEYQQARALDQDTLARRRRVLGEDHPDTLTSGDNLAADLNALGEHERI